MQKEMRGEDLWKLIPQRPPIVMVDHFEGMDGELCHTGLTVEASNLFCVDGYLDECGLTEHIAQSAALRVGYLYTSAGKEIPLGFIGSVDKMTYHSLPAVGEVLRTTIQVVQEIFDITLISASVRVGGCLIAEGQMKIFLKKEEGA